MVINHDQKPIQWQLLEKKKEENAAANEAEAESCERN